MTSKKYRWIILLAVITASQVFAYGGGTQTKKSCKPLKITEQTPSPSSVVGPGASFSFVAGVNTKKRSIAVIVKGEPVDLTITENDKGGFLVEGKLPESVKDGFARIKITGETSRNCSEKGGWLLKIGDA